jgi:hypothetical protein
LSHEDARSEHEARRRIRRLERQLIHQERQVIDLIQGDEMLASRFPDLEAQLRSQRLELMRSVTKPFAVWLTVAPSSMDVARP